MMCLSQLHDAGVLPTMRLFHTNHRAIDSNSDDAHQTGQVKGRYDRAVLHSCLDKLANHG